MKSAKLVRYFGFILCLITFGFSFPVLAAGFLFPGFPFPGDDTQVANATANTFIDSSPDYVNTDMSTQGSNGGQLGALEIAAAVPNTMETLIAFNTAPLIATFNAQLGVDNWTIGEIQILLPDTTTSGNPIYDAPASGSVTLSYVPNNSWFNPATAGPTGLPNTNLTWNSIYGGGAYSTLLTGEESLGTFAVNCLSTLCGLSAGLPTGPSDFENALTSGGYITILGTPADNQVSFPIADLASGGSGPELVVEAIETLPIPEPNCYATMLTGLAVIGLVAYRRNKKGSRNLPSIDQVMKMSA